MKYYRYKMNDKFLNIMASIAMVILLIIYHLIFGFSFKLKFVSIVYLFFWFLLHELIHGLFFHLFGGASFKHITFGAKLENGVLYCMCKEEVNKRIIITSLLAPFTLIGVFTLIISIIYNLPFLGLLSLFNIGGAIGDIFMFLMFIKLPNDIKYTDLDDPLGFTVISNMELKDKYLGFNLIESGKYSDLDKPKDFKKITLSKLSSILFILMIITVIINLF